MAWFHLANNALSAIFDKSPRSVASYRTGDKVITAEHQILDGLGLTDVQRAALEPRVRDWLASSSPIQVMSIGWPDVAALPYEIKSEIMRRVIAFWYRNAESGLIPLVYTKPPHLAAGLLKGLVFVAPVLEWIISTESSTEIIFEKSAGHKYLKRLRNPSPPPSWRYVYRYPSKKGLVVDEHLVQGAKIKGEYQGQIGHFEVLDRPEKDIKKDIVKLRHDETGKTIYVKLSDLRRMIERFHGGKTLSAPKSYPVPQTTYRGPAKLQKISMQDLPAWSEVIGFAADEKYAAELAGSLKSADIEFGIMEQPTGYLVVKRQRRQISRIQRGSGTAVAYKTAHGIDHSDGEYLLVEAEDLISSHKPGTFAPDPRYPTGVQERVYQDDPAEQRKVLRIAQYMDPRFLVNTNTDGVNGPPVVNQDMIVLGGNGRTMGIREAYLNYPESAKAYVDHLAYNAATFGFSSIDVRRMKQPVLIRRIKVEDDLQRQRMWARVLNEPLTQGMDPRTEEVALAVNYITPELMAIVAHDMEEGQTINAYLSSGSSRRIVQMMLAAGIFDEFNQAKYINLDKNSIQYGLLNEEGKQRVQRIFTAAILPDSRLLRRIPSYMLNVLSQSVPFIIRAGAEGWDLTPSFRIAIDAYLDAKDVEADTPAAYLRRTSTEALGSNALLALQKDKTAQALFAAIFDVGPKKHQKKVPSAFREFANRAEYSAKLRERSEGFGLFGEETKPESMAEALDISFGISQAGQKIRRDEKAAKLESEAAEAGMNVEQWEAYSKWAVEAEKLRKRRKNPPEKPAIIEGIVPGDPEGNKTVYAKYIKTQAT